jgi:hypothetical protein
MWIPVRTRSFIRQVVHSKFRLSEDGLLGPDARASYMEIACIKFTVWTTNIMVRTHQASIWKLRATVLTTGQHRQDMAQFRKEFQRNLESRSNSCLSGRLMSTVRTTPKYFKPDAHLNLQPINRGP